jgi:lipopolysaccharide heptosyltransferase II
MNILIVNPFGIGDVLFTTPMIQVLKEKYPDSKIGFLCNKRTKPILETNPCIDKIYVYEKDDFRVLWEESKRRCIRKFLNLLRSIKKDKYTVVFDLSLGRWYGFFLMLIRIRTRIGYNYKNRGRFLTIKVNIDGYHKKHIVEYYLTLLKYFGITPGVRSLKLSLEEKNRDNAIRILKESNVDESDLIIGMVPAGGTSWGPKAVYKHWPVEYFTEVADRLAENYNVKILVFGSQKESQICKTLVNRVNKKECMVDLSGKTDLLTLAVLMGKCKIILCNDGGPLHIAVSQGVKTISIFGPVDEKVYGPYPVSQDNIVVTKDVTCRPCYRKFKVPKCKNRKCIQEIKPKEVITIVEGLLDKSCKVNNY